MVDEPFMSKIILVNIIGLTYIMGVTIEDLVFFFFFNLLAENVLRRN